jgi:hypothetical protein
VARGDLDPDTIRKALGEQKRLGQILVESRAVSPDKVNAAWPNRPLSRKPASVANSTPRPPACALRPRSSMPW